MATRVNLLPWREQRRHRFWRFWCLLLIGSAFAMGLLVFSLSRLLEADRVLLRTMQDANVLLLIQYAGHQQRLDLRQRQVDAIQARQLQRARTEHWQPILTEIAEQLPARIWLTRLEFHQGTLGLTGYSLAVSDLRRLDAAMGSISGLRHGKVGKTQRDTQGRWQFYYQLSREPDHAAAP